MTQIGSLRPFDTFVLQAGVAILPQRIESRQRAAVCNPNQLRARSVTRYETNESLDRDLKMAEEYQKSREQVEIQGRFGGVVRVTILDVRSRTLTQTTGPALEIDWSMQVEAAP